LIWTVSINVGSVTKLGDKKKSQKFG